MFKLLKSKKGFTLVELMIVVVIMAILVAVAVPIFSAVTKNSRTKTCVANMREIVSQITTAAMSNNKTYSGTISYDSDGEAAGTITSDVDGLDATAYAALFQVTPYCPASGSYTITIAGTGAGDSDGSIKVTVKCAGNDDGTDHVYSE